MRPPEGLLGARAEFVLLASLFEAVGVKNVRRRLLYKCSTPETYTTFTLNTEDGLNFEHIFERKQFQKGECTPCQMMVLDAGGKEWDRCATVLQIDDLHLSVQNILVQYSLFPKTARLCDKGLRRLTKAGIAELEGYWDRSIALGLYAGHRGAARG